MEIRNHEWDDDYGISSETTIPGISSEPTETRESRVSRRKPQQIDLGPSCYQPSSKLARLVSWCERSASQGNSLPKA